MRFYLIDRIVEFRAGEAAAATKNVTLSEDFFADHFPRRPVMPGMLLVEGMAQLASVLLEDALRTRHGTDVRAHLTGIERTKFREMVKPGDTVRYEAKLLSLDAAAGKAGCRALVGDREVTSTNLLFGFREVRDETLRRNRRAALDLWMEGLKAGSEDAG
jgi:3-hydroxyacyl-[acyl-carrier-protein] dehydratase